jgi:hypothetical protein
MWREAYIESQSRMPPNYNLAADLLNQQVRVDNQKEAYRERKAEDAC